MFKPRILHSVLSVDESKKHLDYLPAGIGFIILLGVLIWILTSVDPDQINSFLLPDSFLLISIVLHVCFSCGLLFLTLNVRRAVMWSTFLTLVFWFQFQHVLDLWVFLYVLLPFTFLEIILTVLREK